MSTIVFENDSKTQKISISIQESPQGNIEFSAKFDPVIGKQDKNSWHYVIASGIIGKFQSVADETTLEVE